MGISGITPINQSSLLGVKPANEQGKDADVSQITASFGKVLENALQSVDQQEKQVQVLNEQFVTGQISDVHTLMIASEKAQLGLQLTVQVRNKVIEAYQEIMRTQL